jgi:hypothetical protein
MGPGEHRPHDEEYWQRPWARALFAGDLFEAIPFGDQPTIVYTTEAADATSKHFLGEVAFGYGLLITPTCDMAEQHSTGQVAHTLTACWCRLCRSISWSSRQRRSSRASASCAAATRLPPTCTQGSLLFK